MATIDFNLSLKIGIAIRRAIPEDKPEWLRMRQGIWPEAPLNYLDYDLDETLADPKRAVFIASSPDGKVLGFLEASTREYAEGCETTPVGYIESWFVNEEARNQGVGGYLVRAAEDWARQQGYSEMASDTWLENQTAITAHLQLGFEEVERLVHFTKKL